MCLYLLNVYSKIGGLFQDMVYVVTSLLSRKLTESVASMYKAAEIKLCKE